MKNSQFQADDLLKGAVAGLVAGIAASFVMNGFQALWTKVSELQKDESEKKKRSNKEESEPTTVKAAEMISEKVFDHHLTKGEKAYAGPAMHYAMGGGSGLIYGLASEFAPFTRFGAGMPFGAAVWLAADDLALPALGLAKSPLKYPPSTHAYALASHLVYGLTTELVRGAVREALD